MPGRPADLSSATFTSGAFNFHNGAKIFQVEHFSCRCDAAAAASDFNFCWGWWHEAKHFHFNHNYYIRCKYNYIEQSNKIK